MEKTTPQHYITNILNKATLNNLNGSFLTDFLSAATKLFTTTEDGQPLIREYIDKESVDNSDNLFRSIINKLDQHHIFHELFDQKQEVPRDPVYGKFDPLRHASYYDVVATPTDLMIDIIQFAYSKNPSLIQNLSDREITQLGELSSMTCQMTLDHSFKFYQTIRTHALKRGIPFFVDLEKEAVARGMKNAGFSLEDCANMYAPYQKNFSNIFLTAAGKKTRVYDNPKHIPSLENITQLLPYFNEETKSVMDYILKWQQHKNNPRYFHKEITISGQGKVHVLKIKNALPLIALMEVNLDGEEKQKFLSCQEESMLAYLRKNHLEHYKNLITGTESRLSATIGIEIETNDSEESILTYILGRRLKVNFDADASVTDRNWPNRPQREYTSGIIRTDLDLKRFLFFTAMGARDANPSCGTHIHFGSFPFLILQAKKFELAAFKKQLDKSEDGKLKIEYEKKCKALEELRQEIYRNFVENKKDSICVRLLNIKTPEKAQAAEFAFFKSIILSFGEVLEPRLRSMLREGILWDNKALWAKCFDFQGSTKGEKLHNTIKEAPDYRKIWEIINEGIEVPTRQTRTFFLNIEALMRQPTVENRGHEGTVNPATIEAFVRLHLRLVKMIQRKFKGINENTDFNSLDYSTLTVTPEEASALIVLYLAERAPYPKEKARDKKMEKAIEAREKTLSQCQKIIDFVQYPKDFSNTQTIQGISQIIDQNIKVGEFFDLEVLKNISRIVEEDYPTSDKNQQVARQEFKEKLTALLQPKKLEERSLNNRFNTFDQKYVM